MFNFQFRVMAFLWKCSFADPGDVGVDVAGIRASPLAPILFMQFLGKIYQNNRFPPLHLRGLVTSTVTKTHKHVQSRNKNENVQHRDFTRPWQYAL